MDKPILVVGLGSIGKRHIEVMKVLGVDNIEGCDINLKRCDEAKDQFNLTKTHNRWNPNLLKNSDYFAVIICTSPNVHVPITIDCLENGVPVMIEKPLTDVWHVERLDELIEVARKSKVPNMVAYTYRYNPVIKEVKRIVDSKSLGTPVYARLHIAQDLRQWHPQDNKVIYENFERREFPDFYMSYSKLGGGTLNDESHAVDTMRFLFSSFFHSEPTNISAYISKRTNITFDVDDVCDLVYMYFDKKLNKEIFSCAIHLDLLDMRGTNQGMIRFLPDGQLNFDLVNKKIEIFREHGQKGQDIYELKYERNDFFAAQMQYFLKSISENKPVQSDVIEGAKTVECMLMAAKAAGFKNTK